MTAWKLYGFWADLNLIKKEIIYSEAIRNSVIYIIIRYWVCLFVRYRNHLTVVQFQNQAHIRNPHGTSKVCKTIWGDIKDEQSAETKDVLKISYHILYRLDFMGI